MYMIQDKFKYYAQVLSEYIFDTSNKKMENHFLKQLENLKKILPPQQMASSINYQELSYHQYDHLHASKTSHEMITALTHLAQSSPDTKIYDKVLANHASFSNSILTYAHELNQISVKNSSEFHQILVHCHYSSQSILLAAYLQSISKKKPVLIGSQEQMKNHWVNCVVSESQVDKESYFKSLVDKSDIKIHYWENKEQIKYDDDALYIVDLFNVHPTVYQPYLLSLLQKVKNSKANCLLYCSHLQEEEIIDILGQIQSNWEFFQLNATYPVDIIQAKIQQEFVKFLNEESNHPNKQDIVIFHEPNLNFIKKISQILKKNLISNYKIIGNSNENVGAANVSNIFIATNFDMLMNWKYPLNRVFYVFDYRKDVTFGFDYNYLCYVEGKGEASQKETLKRMSIAGASRLGKYCYQRQLNQQNIYNFLNDKKSIDLGSYCLKMIDLGFGSKLDAKDQNIKECLEVLQKSKIIQKNQTQYSITQKNVLNYIHSQMCPLFSKLILENKNNPKLAYLLMIAVSVLMTPGSIREPVRFGNQANDRPTGVWRQTGYLHSCIDIVVRCKIIEARVNRETVSRRLTSKRFSRMSETEFDVFGSLFEVIQANRMTFDEMKLEDLIREELLNEKKLLKLLSTVEEFAEEFQLEEVEFTNFDQINEVITALLTDFDRGAGVFSGSRRIGYFIKGHASGVFPNKHSLINLLNERPSFIYINRLIKKKNKFEILMCNHLSQTLFMEIFGELPSNKQSSYGQTQIQFHGISSATFTTLWRGNGYEVKNFQQKFECYVEPSEDIAMITIHCSKDKQKLIKNEFDQLLAKIKKKITMETKIVNYFGTTNAMLGSGGATVQIIKKKYVNTCTLSNLDLSVEEDDLYDLFDEFFTLRNITINPPDEKNPHYKSAVIEFLSQKDYYRFRDYYHECMYMDRLMKVLPIQTKAKKENLTSQMYIEMSWFAWKSHCKAILEFEEQQKAIEAAKSLQNGLLDNKKVKVELKEKKLIISNLKSITDEIFISRALEHFGNIKSIEIQRTPLKQHPNIEAHISSQIKEVYGEDDVEFEIRKVEKLKNGLRKCEVTFNNIDKLNKLINELNQKSGIVGVGRVHLQSWFTYPIQIPNGCNALYDELVGQILKKLQANHRIKLQNQIFNGQEYIVSKSGIKQEIDAFKQKAGHELAGFDVDLTGLQRNILLSEVGIQNLIDLEQKYVCRLIPDFNKKTLAIQTKFENVKKIKQEIKAKVQDKFFYRVPLNQKAFKYFKEHPDKYQIMEKQYHLSHLELQEVGKNIILEGSANHIGNALNYLMHLIESLMVPMEQMLNADVCGICCEEPFRPYRLQQCGHKFCMQCVVDNIRSTLGDITMFPIKCPQCLAELVIDDLNALLTNDMEQKLVNIAVNQYAGKNPQIVTFCFTAGCKQVNFLEINHFRCDACHVAFCLQCKMNYHPGLTCQQAKEGGNALFEKYMKENNIRKCPNKSCAMPIFRIDGCYRVTCSRCAKSMCFKCDPDKMEVFDNYNDCYRHLSQVHGSYW